MNEFKKNRITIQIDGELTEGDKKFIVTLLSCLDKGYGNPAFQVHSLCMLFTGKPFSDVVQGMDTTGPPAIMSILGSMPKELIQSLMTKNMSEPQKLKKIDKKKKGTTIDEFLDNFKMPDEENGDAAK